MMLRHTVLVMLALAAGACSDDDDAAALATGTDDASTPFPSDPSSPADSGTAGLVDASYTPDAAMLADADPIDAASAPSRCTETETRVSCPKETLEIATTALVKRTVYWQIPNGTPPAAGWPVAVMFQGSLFSSERNFDATKGQPFGAYYQALTLKKLLDAGYAIVAPEAHMSGQTFWDTNVPPWSTSWAGAPDDRLMILLFAAMAEGQLGPLDTNRLFATGISSGGYMTSRMAVSYPGRFRALAIQSASYATCSGPLCSVPAQLPADHPPTLFLHGAADLTVPITTMREYRDRLQTQGREVSTIENPSAGHEWIAEAPDAVLAFFRAHP